MTLPTENLAQLISQKRRVLAQLREIGVRQGQLVESADVGPLLKLLAAKQRLIAALQEVEKRLAPHHEEDPDARQWPSPERRAACAAEAAECSRLLQEVMEMERAQEARLTARRDELAGRLKTANTAHAAHAAYKTHATPKKAPDGVGA